MRVPLMSRFVHANNEYEESLNGPGTTEVFVRAVMVDYRQTT